MSRSNWFTGRKTEKDNFTGFCRDWREKTQTTMAYSGKNYGIAREIIQCLDVFGLPGMYVYIIIYIIYYIIFLFVCENYL